MEQNDSIGTLSGAIECAFFAQSQLYEHKEAIDRNADKLLELGANSAQVISHLCECAR